MDVLMGSNNLGFILYATEECGATCKQLDPFWAQVTKA